MVTICDWLADARQSLLDCEEYCGSSKALPRSRYGALQACWLRAPCTVSGRRPCLLGKRETSFSPTYERRRDFFSRSRLQNGWGSPFAAARLARTRTHPCQHLPRYVCDCEVFEYTLIRTRCLMVRSSWAPHARILAVLLPSFDIAVWLRVFGHCQSSLQRDSFAHCLTTSSCIVRTIAAFSAKYASFTFSYLSHAHRNVRGPTTEKTAAVLFRGIK